MDGKKPRRTRVRRFTAVRRARFLEVLEQTGNRTAAADAIGIDVTNVDARRARDAGFAAACEAAAAAADRRLAGARHAFDGVEDGRFEVIQRARTGRLQIMAVRSGRWTKAVEDRFIAALRSCGNVAASARLVGFSESAIWWRRRKWPDFARRIEEALEDAEVRLEFRLACIGNNVGAALAEGSGVRLSTASTGSEQDPLGTDEVIPFDPEFALKFLKWREEKRRGGGRRGKVAAPPPIEDVTARIVAKVRAIKRHKERDA